MNHFLEITKEIIGIVDRYLVEGGNIDVEKAVNKLSSEYKNRESQLLLHLSVAIVYIEVYDPSIVTVKPEQAKRQTDQIKEIAKRIYDKSKSA